MTLYQTIETIKSVALRQPVVGSAAEGNIYEFMNANPRVRYGVFFITQGQHAEDENLNRFSFSLFYIDRLRDNMEDNRLQIQSAGKELISNVLAFMEENWECDCGDVTYHTFTEKFADECAGVYASVVIAVPKDVICAEDYSFDQWNPPYPEIRNQIKSVEYNENGEYSVGYDSGYTGLELVTVKVDVPTGETINNQSKSMAITANTSITISYDPGYTGLEKVDIDVNVPTGITLSNQIKSVTITGDTQSVTYDEGYTGLERVDISAEEYGNARYQEGYEEGDADGYNEGYAAGYDEGYADGQGGVDPGPGPDPGPEPLPSDRPALMFRGASQTTGYIDSKENVLVMEVRINSESEGTLISQGSGTTWRDADYAVCIIKDNISSQAVYAKCMGAAWFAYEWTDNPAVYEDKWMTLVLAPSEGIFEIDGRRLNMIGGVAQEGDLSGLATIGNMGSENADNVFNIPLKHTEIASVRTYRTWADYQEDRRWSDFIVKDRGDGTGTWTNNGTDVRMNSEYPEYVPKTL